MSWNECLYQYHKKHGGFYLGSRDDDGLLALPWKARALTVDIHLSRGGRYGPYPHVRARVPVTLAKPYELAIGAEKPLSGGVNAVLRVVPDIAGYTADYGYPEVTKKRLIRAENQPFTKLVLGSLDFRSALLACPNERVDIRPGPGAEGVHLITVTTDASLSSGSSDWYVGLDYEWISANSAEEMERLAQRVEDEFFPRMDRLLDLARAAYSAVTQWPL